MLKALLLLILVFIRSPHAEASSPSFGAYVSIQITQQLLAAPPLPGLEGARRSVSPIAGFVTASPVESVAAPEGAESSTAAGQFQGYFGGLGFTTASKSDLSYFLFGIGSSITGEMLAKESGGFNAKEVKAMGLAAVGGVSYRLLGDKTSTTGLGIFGGPGIMSISSSLQLSPASGGAPTTFTIDPSMYGAYTGAQFKVRIGKFLLNPYIVNLLTFNDTCQKVNVGSGGSVSSASLKCRNGNEGSDIPSGFIGYGLFVGYRAFRFNIMAQSLSADPNMNIKNYAASWTFDF